MMAIERATLDQAEPLFDLMVRATAIGCSPSYPPEVIAIWHQGRSVEGMSGVIAEAEMYTLAENGVPRGFVHVQDDEVVGLFVHPDEHGKGYGSELFRFAVGKIGTRPVTVKATLNSVPFYSKLGCRKVATELVRRHDHDIYIVRMELA